jgi:hypothetical protein
VAIRTLLASGEAVRSAVKRRTSGNVLVSLTTWVDVDTDLDITLAAAVDDVIEVGVNGFWNTEGVNAQLDAVTVVSGSPVTSFSSGTGTPAGDGCGGWFAVSSVAVPVGGPVMLKLVSGDISGGQVTLRLRAKTTALFTRTLFASATNPLQFSAKNLGPN